ncbi:MAG: hypothetical protein AB1505_07825 [Candidatus Latescibacterota bacterium]
MAKKRKDIRAIQRRLNEARQRRQQQRRKHEARLRQREERRRQAAAQHGLGLADAEAPPGFIAVGMSQAVATFARPLLDRVGEGTMEQTNEALQLAMEVWNYTLGSGTLRPTLGREEIVARLGQVLGTGFTEAEEVFDSLVARKEHLFPDEVQPRGTPLMFQRKEGTHLIPDYDYQCLGLVESPVAPEAEDLDLVAALRHLDRQVEEGSEYGEWEEEYLGAQDTCAERFGAWLDRKQASERAGGLSECADIFIGFVYGYRHGERLTLARVGAAAVAEFFSDHLLRKVTAEPQEYVEWMPALKLLYTFLQEIGYVESAAPAIRALDEFEPQFMALLRRRYG